MSHDFESDKALIGCTVHDAAGATLGPLTVLYADAETGEVGYAGITMIRRGRRRTVIVPLDGARTEGRTVTVRCGRQLVRRAPNMQLGRRLPAEAEPRLYALYEVPYKAPAGRTRRLHPLAQ
jgi:hypothetical protein